MTGSPATLPPPPGSGAAAYRRPPPRWGVQRGLWQPRQPAFWLFVISIVLGVLYALLLLLAGLLAAPLGLFLSLLLMLLYLIPIALVIRWLDLYEREPRSMVIGAFLWGALVAPFLGGLGNDIWGVVVTKLGGAEFASQWSAALTAPVIEETYKYLGVVLLFLIARLEFDDLIDGFVYGALVGAGFAFAENIYYFIFVFGGDVASVIYGFYLRVIATGLYGHITFTGIAGIGLSYFVTRRFDQPLGKRWAVAAGLFLVAIAAHFIWNSPLFDTLPVELYGVVKGSPFLIGLIVLVYLSRRREHAALAEVLSPEVGGPGLLPYELALLRDPRSRRAARRSVRRASGPQAERVFNQLQREQLRLALVASGVDSVDDARIHQQRALCAALRASLLQFPGVIAALGVPTADVPYSPTAVEFTPDVVVGPSGAWAWRTPDQRDAHRVPLAPGLRLQVVESRGDWLLVRAAAGWHGWTGRPYLTELKSGPPGPPPAPPAAPGAAPPPPPR